MVTNISAFMESLGPSQNAFYLIKEWNKAIDDTQLSLSAFVNAHSVPFQTCLFSYKLSSFLSSYEGVLISTSIKNAAISIKAPTRMDRYLYLWDLNWLRKPTSYNAMYEVLSNDKIKLLARSEEHADMIENFCNKKTVGIVDNWNVDQIREIVE